MKSPRVPQSIIYFHAVVLGPSQAVLVKLSLAACKAHNPQVMALPSLMGLGHSMKTYCSSICLAARRGTQLHRSCPVNIWSRLQHPFITALVRIIRSSQELVNYISLSIVFWHFEYS